MGEWKGSNKAVTTMIIVVSIGRQWISGEITRKTYSDAVKENKTGEGESLAMVERAKQAYDDTDGDSKAVTTYWQRDHDRHTMAHTDGDSVTTNTPCPAVQRDDLHFIMHMHSDVKCIFLFEISPCMCECMHKCMKSSLLTDLQQTTSDQELQRVDRILSTFSYLTIWKVFFRHYCVFPTVWWLWFFRKQAKYL